MRMKDVVACLHMAESNYYVNGVDICLVAADHIEGMIKKANEIIAERNRLWKELHATDWPQNSSSPDRSTPPEIEPDLHPRND